MTFRGNTRKAQQRFETPEELYLRGALPRTAEAVSSLWIHQGDVLRAYAENHKNTADLALELPTGTGKTLPGLLIAEWVRRKGEGPVLYATPLPSTTARCASSQSSSKRSSTASMMRSATKRVLSGCYATS